MQENIALNNLLQFLNISSEQDNMAEVTYFTCLKVLAEGIAKLPLSLQQVTEDGGIQELRDNKIWQTVRVRPNPYMSPTDFWTIVENCRNHWGNGYVLIDRSHDGIKLWTLNPECMRIYLGNLQELQSVPDVYYIYNDPDSGQEHIYPSEDILHFKSSAIFGGLVGMSVQEKLRMSLHGAYSSQKMLNELYDNGFVPKAVVQFGGNAEANTELQKKYLKMMQDYVDGKMEGTKSFLPVSYGTNIQPLNIKLTDGQFLELRQYTALQIASAFGIKPNHLNDYTKSSYANSETQQLAFYTDTMLYIIKQYEEELNFKLLSAQQRADGCRFKFNIAAVLRGDTKSQVESLTQGISCGLYTPNEARRNIDLPNRPGGDRLYFNGSNIPIELAGKQYVDTIAEEVGEKAVKCLEKAAESAIMELKSWVTIDGNHVFIDDGSGGGSGGGASIARSKLARGKYPTSDEEINSIIHKELSGIKFSALPVYNSRIGSAGKTTATISPSGRIRIKSIEIGKQYKNTKEALIDTIIHEELEARIFTRSYHSKKYQKLNNASDSERHKYINRVIKKYYDMKGWNYGLV